LAKTLVAMGEIELMSTTVLPLTRPAAMPSAPNSAASTSGVSGTMVTGTMVKTMSARSATSRAEAHCVALLSTMDCGYLPRVKTYS